MTYAVGDSPGYAKQLFKSKKAKTRAQKLAWNLEHRDLNNKYRSVTDPIPFLKVTLTFS